MATAALGLAFGGLALCQELSEPNPPLSAVEGVQREAGVDLVELVSGESLRGEVVNTTVLLHTPYGSLPLQTGWLAGILFDRTAGHFDQVVTGNRNRFCGFVNDAIQLQKESGETITLTKADVQRIVFRPRGQGADGGLAGRFLEMNNGDLLSGRLSNWAAATGADANTAGTSLEQIELVQFTPVGGTARLLLRNGKESSVALGARTLRLELDLGLTIDLPVAQVKTIYGRGGSLPLAVRREFEGPLDAGAGSSNAPAPTPEGLVWIRAGRFQMGSLPGEKGRGTDEDPPTEMVITHGFWMGQREVTQGEYLAVVGTNPSGFQGLTNHPVEKVTWNEANAYCAKRTEMEREAGRLPEGFVYRLPTEAEWEYACRAGATTRFSFGDDPTDTALPEFAWFITNSDSSTQPVGGLKPNAWGLFDMHGNVWEWCQDLWQDAYPGGTVTNPTGPTDGWLRVARGGSWLYDASFCRSANRDNYGPDNRCSDIGFRVVLGRPL